MSLLAGIDGGGSATRVLIVSTDGRRIGLGRAGTSNPNSVGLPAALGAVAEAFAAAWHDAGLEAPGTGHRPARVASAFFGLAGFASFPRAGEMLKHLADLPWVTGAKIEADHDLRIAHAGALEEQSGIVVVAGTGSAAYARTTDGRVARSGGGGPWIDDAGGGIWLATQALRAAFRAWDGRGPATVLSQKALGFFQADTVLQIAAKVTTPSFDRRSLAAFAPKVLEAAAQGDAVAESIRQSGADELSHLVAAVSQRLSLTRPLVAAVGGLTQVTTYHLAFTEACKRRLPEARLEAPRHSALVGAVRLAFQLRSETIAPDLVETLDRRASLAARD